MPIYPNAQCMLEDVKSADSQDSIFDSESEVKYNKNPLAMYAVGNCESIFKVMSVVFAKLNSGNILILYYNIELYITCLGT